MENLYISDNSRYVTNFFVVQDQYVCENKTCPHGFLCDCRKAVTDDCVQITEYVPAAHTASYAKKQRKTSDD